MLILPIHKVIFSGVENLLMIFGLILIVQINLKIKVIVTVTKSCYFSF